MIVAFCSLSGAPGVSTLAAAVAACWPSTPLTVPVLVEADASGGDVAAWHGIAPHRGAVSLAAAARTYSPSAEDAGAKPAPASGHGEPATVSAFPLLGHSIELPGGLRVVSAPADPLEAGRAVDMFAHHPGILTTGRATVLDVGRAVPGSAGAGLLRHADVVVVAVAAGEVEQARRLSVCAPALSSLREWGTRVGLAVTAPCPHSDAEVSEVADGLPVWARVPHDPAGAALVRGEHTAPLRLRHRWAAWRSRRHDPDSPEWMPLLAAAKGLAELCDDFTGIGLAGRASQRKVRVA